MELIDRIGRAMNTEAFDLALEAAGSSRIEFQCTWAKESRGDFDNLPDSYKKAILAGESELAYSGPVDLLPHTPTACADSSVDSSAGR